MFLQDVNLRSVIFLEVFFYLILATTTTPSVWAKDRTIPDQTLSKCDPYNNYACLDSYLGEVFLHVLFVIMSWKWDMQQHHLILMPPPLIE